MGGAKTQAVANNSIENFDLEANTNFGTPTWALADSVFMAEKGTGSTGHYDNIVNTQHVWVGLGNTLNSGPGGQAFSVYAQEFE